MDILLSAINSNKQSEEFLGRLVYNGMANQVRMKESILQTSFSPHAENVVPRPWKKATFPTQTVRFQCMRWCHSHSYYAHHFFYHSHYRYPLCTCIHHVCEITSYTSLTVFRKLMHNKIQMRNGRIWLENPWIVILNNDPGSLDAKLPWDPLQR